MKNQKNIILFLVISVALIGVIYYFLSQVQIMKQASFMEESTNQNNTINSSTTKNLDHNKKMDYSSTKPIQSCSPNSSNFICANVTQGMEYYEPNYVPPKVCGCKPSCPDGQAVIVSQGSGFWSDGSHKGIFTCSSVFPA